jgi:CRISPR/Cas system-associated exonuclease Cas4 (RecB family)
MSANQPTKYTWSYSSIGLFKQCPHKYYRIRVKKDIVEPESDAMRYGTEVHKAAEDYIKDGTPIPPQFSFMQKALDTLKAKDGEKMCEFKMGLTKNLTPCDFFDKDVWWRGIADLIVMQDDRAWVVDYKTGKSSKYADTKQLELMALAIFKHFPNVKKVKSGLLFVIANDFVKAEFHQREESVMWRQWLDDTQRLEKAIELQVWNPRPNFSCKGWCPVKDCVHNGKSSWR